jgi:hypothetical protein
MPRISKKAKKAMEKAVKEVRKEKPTRRKRTKKDATTEQVAPMRWIEDAEQGWVLFHENKYWCVSGDKTISFSKEEWENRSTNC